MLYDVFDRGSRFLGDDTFRNHFYRWFAFWFVPDLHSLLRQDNKRAPS